MDVRGPSPPLAHLWMARTDTTTVVVTSVFTIVFVAVVAAVLVAAAAAVVALNIANDNSPPPHSPYLCTGRQPLQSGSMPTMYSPMTTSRICLDLRLSWWQWAEGKQEEKILCEAHPLEQYELLLLLQLLIDFHIRGHFTEKIREAQWYAHLVY